ncbi:hypothetical protein [Nocardia asteroides]|uniref:hypothetical protein n=1 Tax=Nocardia asteroides TaxID=1824 RepID=UPI001E30B2B1|nr:hypothetical protein [Nocardia asteroides]UGT56124.1 hypothetical protein LTT85_04345 [Nocardia asteroides]
MRKLTTSLTASTVYAILATFVFCTMVAETIFLYPNYFHDIPHSLVVGEEFTVAVSVGEVMRPLGMVLTLSAVVATAASLWSRTARAWIAASLAAFVPGMFLLSPLYLWERWTILFDDRDRHTLEELERTVREIEIAHSIRILTGALTAVFAVIAALRTYRRRILLDAELTTRAAAARAKTTV